MVIRKRSFRSNPPENLVAPITHIFAILIHRNCEAIHNKNHRLPAVVFHFTRALPENQRNTGRLFKPLKFFRPLEPLEPPLLLLLLLLEPELELAATAACAAEIVAEVPSP